MLTEFLEYCLTKRIPKTFIAQLERQVQIAQPSILSISLLLFQSLTAFARVSSSMLLTTSAITSKASRLGKQNTDAEKRALRSTVCECACSQPLD